MSELSEQFRALVSVEPTTTEPAPDRLRMKRMHPTAVPPKRAKPGDAGIDLFACLPDGKPVDLAPGKRQRIGVGFAFVTPPGTFGHVLPRSGMAEREGVDTMGGVCDRTYRGEYAVILENRGIVTFPVKHGQKIAQLVIQCIREDEPELVDELPESVRGTDGFGSTDRAGDGNAIL